MLLNKVGESTGRISIRDIIDRFDEDKLDLVAMQMKTENTYWKLSYRDLRQYVRNIGNSLLKMGVKKGDKIGLISENRVEWAITYLAVTSIGAIITPYDILLKQEELHSIIKASEAWIVFTSNAYLDRVLEVKATAPQIKKIIGFDPNDLICKDIDASLKDGEEVTSQANLRKKLTKMECFEAEKPQPLENASHIYFYSLFEIGGLLFQNKINLYDETKVLPSDTAALIFTSGTMDVPKGVMLSHSNIVQNADAVQMGTVLGPGDNWIIVLPYHHTYPTILGVLLPIMTYATVTTVPTLRPNILVETMKDTGATCIPAVPILIERIYKSIFTNVRAKGPVFTALFFMLFGLSRLFFNRFKVKLGPVLFKSLRKQLGVTKLKFFISGAGPIPRDIINGMEILGLTIMQGYGLTETSPVISTTFPEHNRPGTVGLPLSNVEVKIANPDADGNGELLTRGPHVMQGYYKQPEKTAEVIDPDGWLHTGDIARIDHDGYITISGRMKNVIVTKGGKNIYPEEIENLLARSEYISEVIVLPKADKEAGEYPYAVIFPNFEAIALLEKERKKTLTHEEIVELIGQEIKTHTSNIANYKSVRGFEITHEELPKTSSNKVKRYMFKKK